MKTDSRLSMALHALLHMAETGTPVTSQQLAERMCADASVIRRTLAGLRENGFIASEKGHGGGWQIVKSLEQISLYDVYLAVGEPTLFAIGVRQAEQKCLVEKAINGVLSDAIADAQSLLLDRFRTTSIADLANTFASHYRQHKKKIG